MSFERDPDAHLKGVMAIAAIDGANPRLRRLERLKAIRMAQRDRILARAAQNAFRPLGAIKETDPGGTRSIDQPRGGTSPTKPRVITTINRGQYTGQTTATPIRSVPGVTPQPPGGGGGGIVQQPPGGGGGGGGYTPPPPPPPPPPDTTNIPPYQEPPPTGGGGTIVTGGGGGGGSTGGGGGVIPSVDEGLLQELDEETSIPESSSASSPNYLLWAGLALGGYLLYKQMQKG